MNSRSRILTALEHREPNRVPVDLGGMLSTGIMGIAYNKLQDYLGLKGLNTRICNYCMQLAEPEINVLEIIKADVMPVPLIRDVKWKRARLSDGSTCEVPDWFDPEMFPDGSQVYRDSKGRAIGKMPKGGYYFDSIYHPLEEIDRSEDLRNINDDTLCSVMWTSFPAVLNNTILKDLHSRARDMYESTD